MALLTNPNTGDGTYFSENALLPGLVQGGFDEDISAKKLVLELQEVMQSHPNQITFEWLMAKFNEINLDAYVHNFTLTYPLVNNTTYQGKNVYAILRAPRSSSTEGLIISAPFRTLDSTDLGCTPSIALMLSLAKYCRKHKFWAKDLIFLITDQEQLGTQAWLQAYHNIQFGNGILNHGNIVARAGSIQAAINLEIHATKISHIDVKIEGLNGQLPNLDLVNLVHKLCKNEGIQHTFKNRNNPKKKDLPIEQWFHSLGTLFSMVWTQASCIPNGNHGLYHRFGIEAVTLEGYEAPGGSRKPLVGFYQVGRVLEGILRSLNNLLERFHQSYFFYMLTSNDRFIAIGSKGPLAA
ncbi:hypothetical protein RUM43_012921 [Polyplax serrata]|uniref:Uncharacterized protein n=1 Tax=Polyplax serrata TaxID=468196 RepID=A0AAN8S457_POLSC